MAKPAFIYAFDNLRPDRFTELCGLLLASRHKGFLLGGVGADGGIDGEFDQVLGIWHPETETALDNEIIQPGQSVVFQFKHKVTARVGQTQSRTQLLNLYKCTSGKNCELHRNLILRHQPTAYVLITNVEVNSEFRSLFIKNCKSENPNIQHYQIIGLDELESWVSSEMQLRHLYFPTIFGVPRFNLQIHIRTAIMEYPTEIDKTLNAIVVSVLNIGTIPSYIEDLVFKIIIDGKPMIYKTLDFKNPIMSMLNPKPGIPLEPGRKQSYYYPLDVLRQMKKHGNKVFPVEIIVTDEIGNRYTAMISDPVKNLITE